MREGLYRGDCLELIKEVPDGVVDMVLCDLPYGTTQNKWDSIIPLDLLWAQYLRVCRPSAAIVLTASQPFTSTLVQSQLKLFRHEWIWIKNRGSNFANTVREPMKEHESVLVFSRGKWTYNKQMQERTGTGKARIGKPIRRNQKTRTGMREFMKITDTECLSELRVPSSWQKFNAPRGLHPTQKPVDLFEYLIRTYSNESELVLDTCMGSGTTAIACINTARCWLGFEQDETYFNQAIDRIVARETEIEEDLNA